jgi:hypothetical protein
MRRWRDKRAPSPEAAESLARAEKDLAEQRIKHAKAKKTEDKLVMALERNHVAELFLNALENRGSS